MRPIDIVFTYITQADLAAKLDISPQSITQWLKKGKVPFDRVIEVSTAINFKVTPHNLAPKHYPNPTDSIPLDMLRGKTARDSRVSKNKGA